MFLFIRFGQHFLSNLYSIFRKIIEKLSEFRNVPMVLRCDQYQMLGTLKCLLIDDAHFDYVQISLFFLVFWFFEENFRYAINEKTNVNLPAALLSIDRPK